MRTRTPSRVTAGPVAAALARRAGGAARRIDDRVSAVAVDRERRAVGELQQRRAHAHDHRQPEPARDHRRVRRRAAGGEGDARHALVELGHVGRAEILRDQDERAGSARCGPAGRGPATERADVVRAGGQDRVLDRGEHVRELIARFENRLGSGQPARDRGFDGRVQGRVGGHQHTGLDDVGLLRGTVCTQAGGERGDLVARALERRAGARQLGRGITRVRAGRRRPDAPDGAGRHPGRRSEAVEPPLGHHAPRRRSRAAISGAPAAGAAAPRPPSWRPPRARPRPASAAHPPPRGAGPARRISPPARGRAPR